MRIIRQHQRLVEGEPHAADGVERKALCRLAREALDIRALVDGNHIRRGHGRAELHEELRARLHHAFA
ncbi:MAG: hypothetical protein MUF11_15115, partial [Beijerinckiaceae bacterium]|nr:hypothetical protein [Beijerinckiaceae bacterium]